MICVLSTTLYYNKVMTDTAHTFNPTDDSLEARVATYRRVYQSWLDAEASLKCLDDDEWSDTLGDREEVEQALDISIRSLQVASDAFTKQEVLKAKEAGLIDSHEMGELLTEKRQQDVHH